MASEWAKHTAAALDPGSYHDITMDEIADALDQAFLSGAKAMQERAAEACIAAMSFHSYAGGMAANVIGAIDPTTLTRPE